MLETILGVATGFLGNIITGFTNLKAQKLKNEQDLKMREYDLKEREQEAKLQIAVQTAQTDLEIEKAEAAAYVESLKNANADLLTTEKLGVLSETKSGFIGKFLALLMGLVDTFRSFIRPGLTAYLVALTTVLTYQAIEILSAKEPLLTAIQAQALFSQVSDIVIYLTVSCVTWWFGDRRTAKFIYRLNDGNFQDKKTY